MKLIRVLTLFLLLAPRLAQAFDCDAGIYPGFGDSNGIMFHATCGKAWRAILSTPITQDDNDSWGYTNNEFDFMVGIEYQWNWKRLRMEAGFAYINEEIKLYNQRQFPLWLRLGYRVLLSLHCSVVHTSVMFTDDGGRNQVGCDYTFSFK